RNLCRCSRRTRAAWPRRDASGEAKPPRSQVRGRACLSPSTPARYIRRMSAESRDPPAGRTTRIQLSPELQSALASLHEMTARAAEAAQPMLAVAAQAAASLAPLQGVLHEISASMRPVLESGWLEAFQRQMQAIRPTVEALEKVTQGIVPALQAFEESKRTIDAAMQNAEAMGRMGWTFPMNASLRECVDLLLVTSEGPEATDAAFARFYADNENESLLLLLADLRQHARVVEFGALI